MPKHEMCFLKNNLFLERVARGKSAPRASTPSSATSSPPGESGASGRLSANNFDSPSAGTAEWFSAADRSVPLERSDSSDSLILGGGNTRHFVEHYGTLFA